MSKNQNVNGLSLTLDVNGRNATDLVDALEVIIKDIQNGHIQGHNCNYAGDYYYEIQDTVKAPVQVEDVSDDVQAKPVLRLAA